MTSALAVAMERTIMMGFFMLLMKRQWDRWRKKNRCGYCGRDGGHDEHCPWNGIDGRS